MINTNCYLHTDFAQIRRALLSIPNYFDKFEGSLRAGTDEVKAYTVDSLKLVVIAFGRISLGSHLTYCFARKSKAQIAYENSAELLKRQVLVPQPVGYIEQTNSLRLLKSFFIARLVDYQPIAAIVAEIDGNRKAQLFADFAAFLLNLHKKDVMHADLNMNNILAKKLGQEFEFCIVDNTRVKFVKATQKRVLNNLAALLLPIDLYTYTIAEYARLVKVNPADLLDRLLQLRNRRGFKGL